MTQQEALEVLKSGRNVFLTGEPGAGKTHTIGLFVEWMESQDRGFAITASTGIAASHLDGSTIHSWAGLGINRDLDKRQVAGIARKPYLANKIRAAKTLIIDEVSMLDAVTIDDVDKVLRAVHGNSMAFGGIQIVFVGDFYQLPPVNKQDQELSKFAFEADSWMKTDPAVCYLTEQHRQNDPDFLEILTAMRSGQVKPSQRDRLIACQLEEKPATRLFTHNADVDRLNREELAKLPGEQYEFNMTAGGDPYLIETLKKSCLSPEKLVLKVNAVVMFTRNNQNEGYVNGTIGKVVSLKGGITIETLEGARINPSRAEWTIKQRNHEGQKVKAWISQIPLRLAWAITVHKSQGMSLDSASVDLSKTFEFGQGYVAISRVRSLKGLHLSGINDKAFLTHPKIVEQDAIFRAKSL